MKRYVYAFDSSDAAMSAVEYLGANGIPGQHVSLVARGDINKNELPDSLLNVSMDFTPSVKRGAVFGHRHQSRQTGVTPTGSAGMSPRSTQLSPGGNSGLITPASTLS